MEDPKMLREIIAKIVNPSLLSNEATSIAGAVGEAQKECMRKFSDVNSERLLRLIHHEMIRFSIEVEHLGLAQAAITNMKLTHLSMCVANLAQNSQKHHIAIDLIINYFQLEDSHQIKPNNLEGATIMQSVELLKSHLGCNDWGTALALVEIQNSNQRELLKRLVFLRQAISYEEEEQFDDALARFEQSRTHSINIPRIILKQSMALGQQLLKEYCSKTDSMQKFWIKYLLACAKSEEYLHLDSSRSMQTLHLDSANVFDSLPKLLKDFLVDLNSSKWFDRKRCELMISACASLDLKTKCKIANVAIEDLQQNNILRACNGYLVLGQFERFLSNSEWILDKLATLRLVAEYGSIRNLTNKLTIYLIQNNLNRKQAHDELQTLHRYLLKFGLIDQALHTFYDDSRREASTMKIFVEELENAEPNPYTIDNINPIINTNTMSRIYDCATTENDRELTTNVIIVNILTLTLFLKKMNSTCDISKNSIRTLETMFHDIANYFDTITYDATDKLIKATNGLIVAVKSNLDILVDSDIIRLAFRRLVEAIAGTCMVETHYKSAAMLYSQIEDNVNAVKSLMRTGEIDTVIDYAILVHDLTVNRITVNFLRHLEVDHKIVEDFLARSKL